MRLHPIRLAACAAEAAEVQPPAGLSDSTEAELWQPCSLAIFTGSLEYDAPCLPLEDDLLMAAVIALLDFAEDEQQDASSRFAACLIS